MCREMSKGTSQCFQPPSKSQSRRLPVESAMPGTTLQTIQLKAFTSGGCLFGESQIGLRVQDSQHGIITYNYTHTYFVVCVWKAIVLSARTSHHRVCHSDIRPTHVKCPWLTTQFHAIILTFLWELYCVVLSLTVLLIVTTFPPESCSG